MFESEKLNLQSIMTQTKSKILDLAIHGKLIPQDPNDEPASVLLERIRAEKEEQIKQGKIKRDKNESYIFRGDDKSYYEKVGDSVRNIDNEIPFEIPDNWTWARLGSVGMTNIGLTYKPTDINSEGVPVLRSNNIQNGKISLNDLVRVKMHIPESLIAGNGDILICARNGSSSLVGKCAIIDSPGMSFGAFMAIFRSICNPYIYCFLGSDFFRSIFQREGISTQINQLTQSMIKAQLIPMPPLPEQNRITITLGKMDQSFATIMESLN